ncbi:MAG: alpha/beta hydrolase family protein [Syntrophothermus sp.]
MRKLFWMIALSFFAAGYNISAQEKAPAIPDYKQEDVVVNNGDVKLAGTLTLPLTAAPAPAVIMITGSGQQNRDEEIFGFKIFGIIADHLSKNGFAVLRLDDRGAGSSTGEFSKATDKEFNSDIITALEYLKGRNEINATQIGLFGHSEGGLVAQMTASGRSDIAFLILMSAPGIKGDSLIISQMVWMLKQMGTSSDEINKKLNMQKRIYSAVRTDKGWDEIKSELRPMFEEPYNKLSEAMKSKLPPKEEYINKLVDQQLASAKTEWFKYLIDNDPSVYLSQIKIPLLILFGGKDMQVPAEANEAAMKAALTKAGNTSYTIKVFPAANHLYQEAVTGAPQEYPSLKKEFVPGFLDTVSEWLNKLYPGLSRIHDQRNGEIIIRK